MFVFACLHNAPPLQNVIDLPRDLLKTQKTFRVTKIFPENAVENRRLAQLVAPWDGVGED